MPSNPAIRPLPGTKSLVLGRRGGLREIRCAGDGFLLVRREVYEHVRDALNLPLCNQRLGRPMIPYFQPLVVPEEDSHLYVGHDFALSERARQCGYRVYVDTSIVLRRRGADGRLISFGQEKLTQIRSARAWGEQHEERLRQLRLAHRWPANKPAAPEEPEHGWLARTTAETLAASVSSETRLIVELGSWLGLSTRFLLEQAPRATVIAVDHWRGSAEHQHNPAVAHLLPRLYETFLANCWEHRQRLIPLRMSTLQGLEEVARLGLAPDLIYVDADHSYEGVRADVARALALFPDSVLVGDDWNWEGVGKAVSAIARASGRRLEMHGVGWRLRRDPV